MILFRRRKKPPLAAASNMGFRDKLVLCKLGFDLRGYYDRLVDEPLPDVFEPTIKSLEAAATDRGSGSVIIRLR
jgi:hypothetical protein